MTDLWNLWEVKSPPVSTVKTELNFKGITALKEVTFDALQTIRQLGHLDREAAILSRVLYKNRRIFRHDKWIQDTVKVNQCLKRYLKLNFSGLILTFRQTLPSNINPRATVAQLPTKQMLQWVLLRLQTFAQIFARVVKLTIKAGTHLHPKLCLGWSLNRSLLVFSIIARLLVTSKFLVVKSIEWYSSFYKCLPYLKQTADFFPNYNFPADLKECLGEVATVPLKKNTLIDKIFEVIDLEEDDDDEEENDEVKIVKEALIKDLFEVKDKKKGLEIEEVTVEENEEEGKGKGKKGVKRPAPVFSEHEDLGVPVEVVEEQPQRPKKKKKRKFGKNN